jgi:hypothetical protein
MQPDTPKNTPQQREQRPTPDADMQPEDSGTPESQPGASGTPAESAMKQQSKTEHESGSGR